MRDLWIFLLIAALGMSAAEAQPLRREPNTTLRLPEVPGSFGYQFVDALNLRFTAPVALATPPGETNRLFVVEQPGQVVVITNLAAPTRSIFLNLTNQTIYGGEQGLLGLAFHPRYGENGRFFVFRTVTATTPGNANRRHDRLSEFQVSPTNANVAAPTETILFQQYDEASNHNGGDLHFGPDGYLYVSLGDEGGGNDQYNNSQRIDRDFFAGVLRLDVDNRPGSLPPTPHNAVVGNYRIPPDNPFVGATEFLGRPVNVSSLRTEFWAVGLRNPWRMCFDRATGELWIADVGQGARESVFVSRSGANHGWAFREGPIAGSRSGAPADFLTNPAFNHVAPLYAYPHGSGNFAGDSITGGVVYRGNRLSALHGSYIFSDYVRGNVWALRRVPGSTPVVTRLLGRASLSGFGHDPRNGDVLACDHGGGRILRLDYNETFSGAPLPPTLADTGAFIDLPNLIVAPGITAYSVNQPFWSDTAVKRRWFCVPQTNRFLTFTTNEAWGAPPGTVWIKHFDLELTNSVSTSSRRLETRFLVRNNGGIYGVTYRWDSATNATLVPEDGLDEDIVRTVDGQTVTQRWRYPGRAECAVCHNPQAGFSLSFTTAQLNLSHAYGDQLTNQLAALSAAGYFVNPPSSVIHLPAVAAIDDESVSLEWRARSYLAVNCAPCHRPGGTGSGFFDARLDTPTALAHLVNGALNDVRGDEANRVLVPGDAVHSVALQRLRIRGPGQMPPLASGVVDSAGATLLERWIAELATASGAEQATVVATELTPSGLSLTLRQPANHSIRLETARSLEAGWTPLALPGTEPTFPAVERSVKLELPLSEAAAFFRVLTQRP